MKKDQFAAYLSVLLAMIFWSFTFVWYKVVYQYYDPITTVFFRLIISSVFLVLLTAPLRRLQRIEWKDLKWFVLVTFWQPFLYFIGESYGVKLVSSTLSAVIVATIPLFTPFATAYFFKERITRMNLAGIILSIVGVGLVIYNKDSSVSANPLGVLMLFMAVAAGVGYSIVIKRLSGKYNAISIVTYHNIIGIFMFAPLFYLLDWQSFKTTGIVMDAWVPLLKLAIFGSSFAFIFFTFSIKRLGVTKANAFTNAIPVFTAIFAFFVLGEMLTALKFAGIALVMGGLFLSQIHGPRFRERLRVWIKPNE